MCSPLPLTFYYRWDTLDERTVKPISEHTEADDSDVTEIPESLRRWGDIEEVDALTADEVRWG